MAEVAHAIEGDLRAGMHLDLAKAQSEFGKIEKKRTAQIGSRDYKYADLTDILAAVRQPLGKYGFAISQPVSSRDGAIGAMTRLLHASGHTLESPVLWMPAGETAQSAGAAITYARRYSLSALLGISTEDDTDAPQAKRRKDSEGGSGKAAGVKTRGAASEKRSGAGTGAGASSAAPDRTTYPVDPAECSHKFPSGKWLPWRDSHTASGKCCPKCGTDKVVAMEGTNADLGAA